MSRIGDLKPISSDTQPGLHTPYMVACRIIKELETELAQLKAELAQLKARHEGSAG